MARDGSIGPRMPSAALSEGGLNESTPLDQRVPDRTTELSDGPKRGKNESFLPARYERTTMGGQKVIREDR